MVFEDFGQQWYISKDLFQLVYWDFGECPVIRCKDCKKTIVYLYMSEDEITFYRKGGIPCVFSIGVKGKPLIFSVGGPLS